MRRLRDDRAREKRFALFLGAGCSVSSGVPAAATLVRDRWIPRLCAYETPDRSDHAVWACEAVPGYDTENPAASYGALIDRLFLTPEDRQREIEELCDGRTPSFGYAVLAQLVAMEHGRFNVVLTTNFDDLIADALYLYTDARPLVIHHESLAAYIRPTRTRPLVVKLHGDHRLSPRNTALETAQLEAEIQRHTAMVLHDRGLIFMGYGGTDRGILQMLHELPREALPFGAYWVHPEEPSGAIREWLAARGGVWVRSGWFDEVMLLMRNAFDVAHPNPERFNRIFAQYHDKWQELSALIQERRADGSVAVALIQAVRDTEARLPDSWKALQEAKSLEASDPARADAAYRSALERFPDAVHLLGSYAVFLERRRKDANAAEAMYQRGMAVDPRDAALLGNYASFLGSVRHDPDAAETMYRRALESDPRRATVLANYATFLATVRRDAGAAEAMYRRALEADPRHVGAAGNYAVFLEVERKDADAAEAMYRQALDADPQHAVTLGNYADFLARARKDIRGADATYRRALAADPRHANNLANFAGFLLALGDDEGHTVLDRAFDVLRREVRSPRSELECALYLYAHGPAEKRVEALAMARQLIDVGVRSPDWDLSPNVQRAHADGHPEATWLAKLVEVVGDRAEPGVLDDWPSWRDAAPR